MKSMGLIIGAALAVCVASSSAQAQATTCDRACMSHIVDSLIGSMVAHDPERLPLAPSYAATENSHPAALSMMQAWRTITSAGAPALEVIDPSLGQAFFQLTVNEAGSPSVLWGRIRVEQGRISEIELFINRSRGDHGFSFGPVELEGNARSVMHPPAARAKATHEQLVQLARAAFDAADPLRVDVAPGCAFIEQGWNVVDPGLDDVPARPNASDPLGCIFPPFRPTDKHARIIAIDDELGLVAVAAVIPGTVYPYPWAGRMVSAFIPRDMVEPAKMQDDWIKRHLAAGRAPILKPAAATGEVMQVLQLYDGKLQTLQMDIYLDGPGARSPWVATK